MKKTALVTLLFGLFIVPLAALAGDDVSGSVSVGVMGSDVEGDSARFDEYRDMDDGTYGDAELRAFRGTYYLDLEALKIGRDDQSYLLRGGRFGSFTYSLYYDEIPHNLSNGASTFYAGAGTANLLNTGLSSDPARWNEVDYRKDSQDYGFDGEFSFGTPFYVQLGASEKNTDGLMPFSGNSTFSSFGRTTELPAPIDWEERTGFVEGGYRTRSLTATVRAEFSDFDNRKEEFFWEDDFATNPGIAADATTEAPDNEFWKVSGQLVWRTPALSSSLALRGSFSQLESSTAIRNVVADDSSGANVLSVEPEKFDGDIAYGTLDAAWRSVPLERLDLKLFFKYLDKKNDSSVVDITAGGNSAETELFDYSKWAAGLDATYGLPGRTSLDGGYAFTSVDREGRIDNKGSDDNLLYLQLRNRSWERVELRGRYEYLNRDGDFSPEETGESPTDPEYIRNFVRRYDVADLKRNRVEVEATTYLVESLGLGAEFRWQDDDFDATELGLTGVRHYDLYLTADYSRTGGYAAGLYAGYERDETDMSSRRFNPGDDTDPAAGTEGSAFNWTESKEFDTYAYGLFVEVPFGRNFLLSASWDHSDVNGKADFTSGGGGLVGLDEVDDYTKKELAVDLRYSFTARLSLKLGYIYEKYDFADEQWDGYTLLPNSQTILTGAYADDYYEANIGFLEAAYRF